MKDADWKELEKLSKRKMNEEDQMWYNRYLNLTQDEQEHPDWFNGNCLCQTCLSYAEKV